MKSSVLVLVATTTSCWLACLLSAASAQQDNQETPPVGSINCRLPATTGDEVNYYSCKEMADHYDLTVEEFFGLNPELDKDCKTIKPNTDYCVRGFAQPLISTDGRCGPEHNNAVCDGTAKQCCNSETWTCGDTPEDCAPGTCFGGICSPIFSINGTCGPKNGNLRCAGKWGDCCSFEGKCGTGSSFCGSENCQSGNCTASGVPAGGDPVLPNDGPLPWLEGTSIDGTCGGVKGYTCNVIWGNCCGKDGTCETDEQHCGQGCQPEFGLCGPEGLGEAPTSTRPQNPCRPSQTSQPNGPQETEDKKSDAPRNKRWIF